MAKKKKEVRIPPEESSRQAVDSISGYVYQLHQSVLAWFNLGPDELLHIEFAEDIAISDDGKLEFVQVKRVAASITMRSEGVLKLLKALWAFQQANPSRTVTAALVTTSKIGKEQRVTFPGKVAGLRYWRVAAREGSDVEPIRRMLEELDLPSEMKAFVRGASASDLRNKVIRPVRWLEGSQSQDALDRDIEERLVKLGSQLGVAAQASIDALDSLVGYLLKSLQREPELRFVTAADLLTVFQKKTFISVPPGVLGGLILPTGGTQITDSYSPVRDISQIPMPPRTALRVAQVEQTQWILVNRGLLWLHGSSGLGKTTLALLIARHQNVAWRFADLRGMALPLENAWNRKSICRGRST